MTTEENHWEEDNSIATKNSTTTFCQYKQQHQRCKLQALVVRENVGK